MLSVMLVIIMGVLAYVYGDQLLPRPQGGAGNVPSVHLTIPATDDRDPFFERKDYQDLRGTVGVPVQPIKIETKGVNPFVAPK